jgi:hypothetical protein
MQNCITLKYGAVCERTSSHNFPFAITARVWGSSRLPMSRIILNRIGAMKNYFMIPQTFKVFAKNAMILQSTERKPLGAKLGAILKAYQTGENGSMPRIDLNEL